MKNMKIIEGGLLEERQERLEQQMHKKARMATKARFMKQGEKISSFWSSLNMATKPKDNIIWLKNPGSDPPAYATRSDKMPKIGRKHHEKLLTEGLHPNNNKRKQIITEILDKIQPESKLDELSQKTLEEPVSEEGIMVALCECANGLSPGLDGIIYKFYKMLQQVKQEDEKKKKYKGLDIIQSLTMVYEDIEEFRVNPLTKFTEGWMCPIYKKSNRNLIENHRPVTLLNTDYKIYTKDKSIKLANMYDPPDYPPNPSGIYARKKYS